MIRYVDAYRDQFGVELICRVLANTVGGFMTSRGYRAAKTRPLSHRAIRDQVLGDEMERLHAENYGVYGVRKMYYLMRRQVLSGKARHGFSKAIDCRRLVHLAAH